MPSSRLFGVDVSTKTKNFGSATTERTATTDGQSRRRLRSSQVTSSSVPQPFRRLRTTAGDLSHLAWSGSAVVGVPREAHNDKASTYVCHGCGEQLMETSQIKTNRMAFFC